MVCCCDCRFVREELFWLWVCCCSVNSVEVSWWRIVFFLGFGGMGGVEVVVGGMERVRFFEFMMFGMGGLGWGGGGCWMGG